MEETVKVSKSYVWRGTIIAWLSLQALVEKYELIWHGITLKRYRYHLPVLRIRITLLRIRILILLVILIRIRIRILLVSLMRTGSYRSFWCGSWSYLSLLCWSGSGSQLPNKGSQPWKSAQIGLYSLQFGQSPANGCGSGSSFLRWSVSGSYLSIKCGSGSAKLTGTKLNLQIINS